MKERDVMRSLVLTAALVLPLPVTAGSFTPPEGCTTFMTVQSRQCRVSNHYKCAADPAGDQWRADFDQQGPFFLSRINSEAEWVESFDLGEMVVRQVLQPNPADPASFSELVGTGVDSFEFGLSRDNGEETNVRGFDRLTGQSFTIDGITLLETEFDFTETDLNGAILRQSRGNAYGNTEERSIRPALPKLVAVPGGCRSINKTRRPRSCNCSASVMPTIPAPSTMTSGTATRTATRA
jgi:hypothetical protein